MKAVLVLVLALVVHSTALHGAINQSCKAGSVATSIINIHGRLSVYNGGYPNLRIWKIGTKHMFGIYSNPRDLQCNRNGDCNADNDTELPSSLESLNLLDSPVYGDFEIRLLEPFRAGHMQAGCIVDAHKIVRGQSK